MKVVIGQRLGSFEVSAVLGKGGMGEVWRANDSRLGRAVALKVLPEDFADDPERHARFEREAKLLASLNHPNIAALHALEHFDGAHVLVMELVEGEGLDELIARGPVVVDETIAIARQIAEALEAAHEAGIVHRDLKPANVRIRPDGTVKVLDFGLAKAWDSDGADVGLSMSPTMTRHATAAGVILGTAAYMSPEQARGKPVDRRADIWAFGAVLWEMLTGRQLFEGETVSDVLASVLKESPALEQLPSAVPPELRRLLARCLERDVRHRLQWIGEARIALEHGSAAELGASPVGDGAAMKAGSAMPLRIAVAAAVVLAVAVVVLVGRGRRHADAPPLLQASLLPPEGTTYFYQGRQPGALALSPSGDRLAFVARDAAGAIHVWVRRLATGDCRRLDATEGASYPFWSPDGGEIGFFADGRLKLVPAEGGAALVICDAPFGKGGSWNRDGTIIFSPSYNSGVHRVSHSGGPSVPVTTVDAAAGENSHRHPEFLPDGRRFLFFIRALSESSAIRSGVYLGSLDESQARPLAVPATGHGMYAGGYLFYANENVLFARPFDADRLVFRGETVAVVPDVETLESAARTLATVADDGLLVSQDRTGYSERMLVWYDREGRQTGVLGEQSSYYNPKLSPDGRQVAVEVEDSRTGNRDLWIYDLERGTPTRFTFELAYDSSPVWSPDGRQLAFASRSDTSFDLHVKQIGGSSEASLLLADAKSLTPSSWSPDGRYLLYSVDEEDIWCLPMDGTGEGFPFVDTPKAQWSGVFSPDGRWVAYHSMETGDFEAYVTSFPDAGRKYQVSVGGGLYPQWNKGGEEIVYLTIENEVMAVSVAERREALQIGSPQLLFVIPTATDSEFLVDGDRFLVYTIFGTVRTAAAALVSDWHQLVE